jgi:transketolase C-terminal domain/subunit
MSLEKVQERYGEHFINAGVAEQNINDRGGFIGA